MAEAIRKGQVWRGPSGHDYRVAGPPRDGLVPLVDARPTAYKGATLVLSDVGYDVPVLALLNTYTRVPA
jgi:hypothetical protein